MADAHEHLMMFLQYQFADEQLLEAALTHRSTGKDNNERLEFLGDALLGAYIAADLFQRFPHADEGQLTRLRSQLVRRESLAELARDLELGERIRLGGGELKSGGWRRDSILSDTLEALIGAIFLDSDNATCRDWVLNLFAKRLQQSSPSASTKDAKTRLQELLQGRGLPLPLYETLNIDGPAHQRRFTVRCSINELGKTAVASDRSRRKAEQSAADSVLQQLHL